MSYTHSPLQMPSARTLKGTLLEIGNATPLGIASAPSQLISPSSPGDAHAINELDPRQVGADGCLEWQGFRDKDGYGQISKGKEGAGLLKTHRVAWEETYGPIPDGMSVLHKCDNPPCCNEEHLFLGTHDENMADMKAKGRGTTRPGKFKLDPIFKGGISSGSLRA
ncbi:hypothetical protein LCGC14_2477890 [marine sediment metagenome]|uniref:HNH nuclease domain-containing protein n=1 Tax=marine sediment metagenome TaxID=412755 RepID=A0A0F9B8G7_9ZZZZ